MPDTSSSPLNLTLPHRAGAVPVHGDITITTGIDGSYLVVEFWDLNGTLGMRTEISILYYDQDAVDRAASSWRGRFAKERPPDTLHLLP